MMFGMFFSGHGALVGLLLMCKNTKVNHSQED